MSALAMNRPISGVLCRTALARYLLSITFAVLRKTKHPAVTLAMEVWVYLAKECSLVIYNPLPGPVPAANAKLQR